MKNSNQSKLLSPDVIDHGAEYNKYYYIIKNNKYYSDAQDLPCLRAEFSVVYTHREIFSKSY